MAWLLTTSGHVVTNGVLHVASFSSANGIARNPRSAGLGRVHFANGMNGFGTFSTPAGVDPTQASQTLAVTDLTMTVSNPGSTTGGIPLTVQPGATATYSYGVLVGGNATATGVATVVLNQGGVTVAGYSAPASYDPAITMQTFTLPDGTSGAISYDVPYDQINPTLSSQTLTPLAFNLNIAGQKFSLGSSGFTIPPTLSFANGDLVGVNFKVNTPGTPYPSISVINGLATIQTGPTSFVNAPAPSTNASVAIDFANINVPAAGGPFDVTIRVTAGTVVKSITVSVENGVSANAIRDAFNTALYDNGITAYPSGGDTGTRLIIQGAKANGAVAAQQLTSVETFFSSLGAGVGPKLETRTKGPSGGLPGYQIK